MEVFLYPYLSFEINRENIQNSWLFIVHNNIVSFVEKARTDLCHFLFGVKYTICCTCQLRLTAKNVSQNNQGQICWGSTGIFFRSEAHAFLGCD